MRAAARLLLALVAGLSCTVPATGRLGLCGGGHPPSLRLRGGAGSEDGGGGAGRAGKRPGPGDSVVPRTVLDEKRNKWHMAPLDVWPGAVEGLSLVETVPEAVEDCLDGVSKRAFVGSGSHSWEGERLVVGSWRADNPEFPSEGTHGGACSALTLVGEGQSRLFGLWLLEPGASGSFEAVTLSFHAGGLNAPTVEVWEGPWAFDACDLRSQGGTAVSAGKKADVACVACGIGGLEAGERDEFGDFVGACDTMSGHEQRACFGVRQSEVSLVSLRECSVEFTGLAGAGVELQGRARLRVEQSEFFANSVGIYIDDEASAKVANSLFLDNDLGAFYAGAGAAGASADLRNNSVHGKLWFHKRRPGQLHEEHFVGEEGVTYTNESFSDILERLARERSDGLDFNEADYRRELRAGLPEDASDPEERMPLGGLSHAYAFAAAKLREMHDPDDPLLHKRAEREAAAMPESVRKMLRSKAGHEYIRSRMLMPVRMNALRAMEEREAEEGEGVWQREKEEEELEEEELRAEFEDDFRMSESEGEPLP